MAQEREGTTDKDKEIKELTKKRKEQQRKQTKTKRIDEVQWTIEIQLDSSDARKRKND